MKIASYNLEFLFGEGKHSHSGRDWEYSAEFVQARIDHFAKRFSEIDADILFLQELGTEDVLVRILKKIDKEYSCFIAAPDKNGISNAVIYKGQCECVSIPAKASLPVFVSGDEDVIGKRIWSRRDFVQVTTAYQDKPLYLVGVHLKSRFAMAEEGKDGVPIAMNDQATAADGLIRSELFRLSQAKKVRELVNDFFISNPEAAVAVVGDFNADEASVVFEMIRGAIKNSPDALVSASKDLPPEVRFSRIASGNRKKLIDHVLLSKTLEKSMISCSILNEALTSREDSYSGTEIESDHAPVVVLLK